jgi:O-antigen/teichoic acid export membrane protein
MASAGGVRQVLTTGLLALTAAVVARSLGPHSFGVYSGGIAAFSLAGSVTDLGFSLYLVRELSRRPGDERSLMGTALPAQVAWTMVPTVGLLVLGLAAGGSRGAVMLALCPAIALSGFGVARQIFAVRFRATPLLVLDLSTTVLQCLIMIGLALAHAPLIALALNMSFFSIVVGIFSVMLARRVVTFEVPSKAAVLRFVRSALPLGIASLLASLYFTIDMTLLGWLVPPQALGRYAAAVRILTVVVTIPGFIMAAGVPGLSRHADDRGQLSSFAATLAQWITVAALPLAVGVAVFARPTVLILFGSPYLGAVPLIRILMLAGLLSFVSQITGIVLMTQGIIRPQIVFNVISLALNVGGNILLVPHFGVTASAWLTVASEAIVISYGLVVLRKRLDYGTISSKVWRPVIAIAVAGGIGLLLGAASPVAIVSAAAAFVVGMSIARAWPDVLVSWIQGRVLTSRWRVS